MFVYVVYFVFEYVVFVFWVCVDWFLCGEVGCFVFFVVLVLVEIEFEFVVFCFVVEG